MTKISLKSAPRKTQVSRVAVRDAVSGLFREAPVHAVSLVKGRPAEAETGQKANRLKKAR